MSSCHVSTCVCAIGPGVNVGVGVGDGRMVGEGVGVGEPPGVGEPTGVGEPPGVGETLGVGEPLGWKLCCDGTTELPPPPHPAAKSATAANATALIPKLNCLMNSPVLITRQTPRKKPLR